ncbi:MAG: hypothetical protein GY710_20140 [Desulfobacteraceae bacterium]|nr:hypothetical protein [Desulfobacteraceae bacterium]
MSNIEIKRCDECGKEKRADPGVSGLLWPYRLTKKRTIGFFLGTSETVDLCSDDCLSKFVAKLLKGKEDARRQNGES